MLAKWRWHRTSASSSNPRRFRCSKASLDCIRAGHIPGGLKANRDFAECLVGYDASVPADIRTLLFDPQTAGGLLISVSAEDAGAAHTRATGCRRSRCRNWRSDSAHEAFNSNHFLIGAPYLAGIDLTCFDQLPDVGEVMVVVLRHKVEMVDQSHGRFQPRMRNGTRKNCDVDRFGSAHQP